MKFRIIFALCAIAVVLGWYVVIDDGTTPNTGTEQSTLTQPQPSADDDALRKSLGQ